MIQPSPAFTLPDPLRPHKSQSDPWSLSPRGRHPYECLGPTCNIALYRPLPLPVLCVRAGTPGRGGGGYSACRAWTTTQQSQRSGSSPVNFGGLADLMFSVVLCRVESNRCSSCWCIKHQLEINWRSDARKTSVHAVQCDCIARRSLYRTAGGRPSFVSLAVPTT